MTRMDIIDAGWTMPEQLESTRNSRVNLNTASLDELCTLPGIGRGRARRIVRWREQNGPLSGVDALLAIEGIGRSTIGRLQHRVG